MFTYTYSHQRLYNRSDREANLLNDVWVGIPIGSEESYSFRFMRKNQYEEALFKCEDDQFEIDMIIDTNASAIRILEPIAEEINSLRLLMDGEKSVPRFSFQLEKRYLYIHIHLCVLPIDDHLYLYAYMYVYIYTYTYVYLHLYLFHTHRSLGTVHLNAVTRLYGDHATEILELLRKNPAGTIPVVLKRQIHVLEILFHSLCSIYTYIYVLYICMAVFEFFIDSYMTKNK
jgi:paired amphipathic helix protein Sin3a